MLINHYSVRPLRTTDNSCTDIYKCTYRSNRVSTVYNPTHLNVDIPTISKRSCITRLKSLPALYSVIHRITSGDDGSV
jgi:hypothetical protein